MSRSPLVVREATAGDLPRLITLWEQIRAPLTRRRTATALRQASQSARIAAESRLRAALDDPEQRLVVVADGPDVLGMALLSVEWTGRRGEERAATMSTYVVDPAHRRRGAGRSLVAAALAFADAHGLATVAVDAHPDHRETNRYLARLGFAPAVTRRVAPVAALRRVVAPVPAARAPARRARLAPTRVRPNRLTARGRALI